MDMGFHGDVRVEPIPSLPEGLTPVGKRLAKSSPIARPDFILAEGEHTGHAHRVNCTLDQAELFEDKMKNLYMLVKEQVIITHEEHNPTIVEPGTYKIGFQREYDYSQQMSRMVVD